MEFEQLITGIQLYESCKIEMYIFKSALVINENIRFVFLYVLSIDSTSRTKSHIHIAIRKQTPNEQFEKMTTKPHS